MSLETKKNITKEAILDRLNQVMRPYIESRVDWIDTDIPGSTGGRNVQECVWGSGLAGYPLNNDIVSSDKAPPLAEENILADDVGANPSIVGHITEALSYMMMVYSRSHRIRLRNTGNIGTSNMYGTVTFTNQTNGVHTQMQADFENRRQLRGLITNTEPEPQALIDLIDDCRDIWEERAYNITSARMYDFRYCHSSHRSHSSHSSRGRR